MLNDRLLDILSPLLRRRRYLAPALLVSLLFFAGSYYLTVYKITDKNILSYSLMNGWWYTFLSLLFNLLIALLFGLYILLFILKLDIKAAQKRSTHAYAGAGGLIGGLLSAGCPTCGAPLLAWLGAPLALLALPFKGLEIKVLSLVFLLLAVHLLTKNIYKNIMV